VTFTREHNTLFNMIICKSDLCVIYTSVNIQPDGMNSIIAKQQHVNKLDKFTIFRFNKYNRYVN